MTNTPRLVEKTIREYISEPKDASWQEWWSMKGDKMSVESTGLEARTVIITNGALARVEASPVKVFGRPEWLVRWRVLLEYRGLDDPADFAEGQCVMQTDQLKTAFGLAEQCKDLTIVHPDWRRASPHLSVLGLFVRQGPHLNIPNPNHYNSRPTNVSIRLTEDMVLAIKNMVDARRQLPT